MKGLKRLNSALLLICLAATSAAQQAATPQPREETLADAVVPGERERERPPSVLNRAGKSDRVNVTRDSRILARLRPDTRKPEIRFRRESDARLAIKTRSLDPQLTRATLSGGGRKGFTDATIELKAGVAEDDGLPAVIHFGSHSSLVNIDFLRLTNSTHPTVVNVRNVVDPQIRRCESAASWGEDESTFSNRFLLVSDSLDSCKRSLQDRHNDLILADQLPEKLKDDLLEIYDPLFARFSSKLGSEPGLIYVAWWPQSPDMDMRFELSWNRSVLLLFNGTSWQEGLTAAQKSELRESLMLEQIQRRIREIDWPGNFTSSAVSYVQLLARAEQDRNTNRRVTAELPGWIARCDNHLDGRTMRVGTQPEVPGSDCGKLLQFVYDAVARAGSGGEKTAFDIWRHLLKDSRDARKAGVLPTAFIDSSSDGKRIALGITQGSMNWPKFAEELGKLGVKLNIRQTSLGVTAQVLSLEHFHDR